jgi:hypothetical protein
MVRFLRSRVKQGSVDGTLSESIVTIVAGLRALKDSRIVSPQVLVITRYRPSWLGDLRIGGPEALATPF